MNSSDDALRQLRDIDAQLATIPTVSASPGLRDPGLESQQIRVVRLIETSESAALRTLRTFVAHDDPSSVLRGWRNLVVEGLEPNEPTLPKVSSIESRSSGQRPLLSTSEVRSFDPAHYENPWINHARRVVAVLIARVERSAKTERESSGAVPESDEQSGRQQRSGTLLVADGISSSAKLMETRRDSRFKWLASAMLIVRDHPEWSDAEIARHVGIDKSRLSRSPEYRMAATMARTTSRPIGSVRTIDGIRHVEAIDDSFDPNRKPSRQYQDEEDADARLDREMDGRNTQTQRATQRAASRIPTNRRTT